MLTTKIPAQSGLTGGREPWTWSSGKLMLLGVLTLLLAGCGPSGPRALVEGQRLMASGAYAEAIERLATAAALLGGTNAQAWNDLGLAYHHAGKWGEAEQAYQRALKCDHDLSEARFNLGSLYLAQNNAEAAKAEFTAFTLRRPNVSVGFLKLGSAQLRAREPSAAEKSFNEALRLSPENPEALNGLGLARLARGHAAEAVQCFERAVAQPGGYPPALLNLAIVAHQHLRDRPLALQKYREYLALQPPPANAETLSLTVRQLEQELHPPARRTVTNAMTSVARVAEAKPLSPNATRAAGAVKPEPAPSAPQAEVTNVPRPVPTKAPKAPPAKAAPALTGVELAKLPAEPALKRAEEGSVAPPLTGAAAVPAPPASPVGATTSPAPKPAKRGFFQSINPIHLFRSGERTPTQVTPLEPRPSATAGEMAKAGRAAMQPGTGSPPSLPPSGPPGRYAYRSPARPAPGNRLEAERLFTQGALAYQARRLPEAIQAYQAAVRQDPSLFEAHYNLGLAAAQAGNLPLALAAYESALAVLPASVDARYNFALALKQGNYLQDAGNELERILGSVPNETRAHLALGNLYAQQFELPAKARAHYLKVLEVEPRHPQAGAIRFWLAANPP